MEDETFYALEGEQAGNPYSHEDQHMLDWEEFEEQTGDDVPLRLDDNPDMGMWQQDVGVQGVQSASSNVKSMGAAQDMYRKFATTQAAMDRTAQMHRARAANRFKPDIGGGAGGPLENERVPNISAPNQITFLLAATVAGGIIAVLAYSALTRRPVT